MNDKEGKQQNEDPKYKLEKIDANSYNTVILETDKLVIVHVYKGEQLGFFNDTINKFQ